MSVEAPIRVLQVDDEPGFAELAGEFLEREVRRVGVTTATSVADALDHLDDGIDCVVSDYDMPERNADRRWVAPDGSYFTPVRVGTAGSSACPTSPRSHGW